MSVFVQGYVAVRPERAGRAKKYEIQKLNSKIQIQNSKYKIHLHNTNTNTRVSVFVQGYIVVYGQDMRGGLSRATSNLFQLPFMQIQIQICNYKYNTNM